VADADADAGAGAATGGDFASSSMVTLLGAIGAGGSHTTGTVKKAVAQLQQLLTGEAI